jgi:2-polyprenyl-3-methyl-5-hydroxy-6-metoxy-1,4-benzoquinol methylase
MAADDVLSSERARLEEIAGWYSSRDWGFYTRLIHYTYRSIKPFLHGADGMEMGSADGEMTKFLREDFDRLHVLDASEDFVETAKSSGDNVSGSVGLFEEFETDLRFDTIVASHVLEHLVDPVLVVRRAREWLAPAGRLIVVVPNADSLHRRLGVKLGLLPATDALNEQDVGIHHRRVYRRETLEADLVAAGLEVTDRGGVFLKTLSNAQMQEFGDAVVEGFYELGKDFPDLCSEIYAVAR